MGKKKDKGRRNNMADTLIGLVGKGFVIMAADTSRARSIVVMKGDDDKIMQLEQNKILGASGEAGDSAQFCEFIQRNIHYNNYRTDVPLGTAAVANFTRNNLAKALRSRPYHVNLLLGGYDTDSGPALYYMDYLASMEKMDFAVQGYAGHFLYGLLDKEYRPNLSEEEAVKLLKVCFEELKRRFLINSPNFIIKIVDANGVRVLDQ